MPFLNCGNSSQAKACLIPLCGQGIRLLFLTSVQQLMNPNDLAAVCSRLYLLLCASVTYACVCITVYVHMCACHANGQRWMLSVFLSCSPPCFLSEGLSLNLKLSWLRQGSASTRTHQGNSDFLLPTTYIQVATEAPDLGLPMHFGMESILPQGNGEH